MATKVETGPYRPRYQLPFHHVMIDVVGRISPPDRDGYAYVLTYLCVVTGAPFFEPMVSTRHSCLRRAVLRCVWCLVNC